jgi:hypothetical protein
MGALKMARPKKSEEGLTEPFMFRLSKSEALVLLSKVAQSNMKSAEFLRNCVLTNRTTVIAMPQATLEKERMQFLFNKTSNNMNQIAHVMNSANVSGKITDAHYQAALISLVNISKYLKSALNHVD